MTQDDDKRLNDLRVDDLRRAFRRLGLRLTSQRVTVWRLFSDSTTGLTLPEACRALQEYAIGQATVYRVVNSLCELGFLLNIHGTNGEHRYLAGHPGHVHHLICRSCGHVREVTDCDLSTLEKLLAAQTGFAVEGHYLEFYGRCPRCGPSPG
ncbi:MAG: transcriptional repressor [Deltaproteobacteria bacterium]|nr:transcriptional repressor [Deltaproteobacteria bacterium]